MNVSIYYRYAALLPFSITCLASVIISVTYGESTDVSSYANDEYINLTLNEMLIAGLLLSGFITLASATLLLNKHEPFRKNIILSSVTWFLLPGFCIVYLGVVCVYIFLNEPTKGNLFISGIPIIHFIALVATFVHFRKTHLKAETPSQIENL